jgi:hypothetical protein
MSFYVASKLRRRELGAVFFPNVEEQKGCEWSVSPTIDSTGVAGVGVGSGDGLLRV